MVRKREETSGEPSGVHGLVRELLDAQTQLNESVDGCWNNFERIEKKLDTISDRLARIERGVARSDNYGRMVR